MNKKGQSLGGLYSGILVIVAIGLLIAILLYVFSGLGTNMSAAGTTGSIVNETVASVKERGTYLTAYSLRDSSCVVSACTNGTTPYRTVPADNYTATGCKITYIGSTASGFNNTNWLCTYTTSYTADTNAYNATQTMTTQIVAFLPWLGIILLVLAAGVVLFFVIRSFSSSSKGV